jgi:hypothetical protein
MATDGRKTDRPVKELMAGTRSAIPQVCAPPDTKWWTRPSNDPGHGTSRD